MSLVNFERLKHVQKTQFNISFVSEAIHLPPECLNAQMCFNAVTGNKMNSVKCNMPGFVRLFRCRL